MQAQNEVQLEVDSHIEALDDEDARVRSNAAAALGGIGWTDAVPALIEALGDEDVDVRRSAAFALGTIGSSDAVPALAGALDDEDRSVRLSAAAALRTIGSPGAVRALARALDDDDTRVRAALEGTIARSEAVPALIKALGNKDDADVRWNAAVALEEIAPPEAAPALVEALGDNYAAVRIKAAEALVSIALRPTSTSQDDAALLDQVELATHLMPVQDFPKATIEEMHGALAALRNRQRDAEGRWDRQLQAFLRAHPLVVAFATLYLALAALVLFLLGFRPLWLLRAGDALGHAEGKLSLKGLGFDVGVPLRHALLVGFVHHHGRVLDAWVARHLVKARESFEAEPTARARRVHVPLPAEVDGRLLSEPLGPEHLLSALGRNVAAVLIRGEGGAGKTSLACQLSRWAMAEEPGHRLFKRHPALPVLLEADFTDFIVAVGDRLRHLIDAADPIPEEFLRRLLARKRLVVVVDHLSELGEPTREALRTCVGGYAAPANALVVTSRTDEALGGRPRAVVEPLRIRGDYVSEFVGAYLRARGKRDLFPDAKYFAYLQRLTQLVGEREVTVLLAKLYAEQMVAVEEHANTALPESVPELILGYLNELNRSRDPSNPDNRAVHRAAKLAAYLAVEEAYRPAPAALDRVRKALEADGQDPAALMYLEKLRVLQRVGAAEDRVRFTLDPLAEYLAAMYVVERARGDEATWRTFLERAEGVPGAPEAVRGFLLATRDCCLQTEAGRAVPAWVPEALARLAQSEATSAEATHEEREGTPSPSRRPLADEGTPVS